MVFLQLTLYSVTKLPIYAAYCPFASNFVYIIHLSPFFRFLFHILQFLFLLLVVLLPYFVIGVSWLLTGLFLPFDECRTYIPLMVHTPSPRPEQATKLL